MSPLPKVVYRVANAADSRIAETRRAIKRGLGLSRPHRVVAYRGFGTRDRVVVRARVLEDRGEVERNLSRGLVGGAMASFVRFYTAEVPGVVVEAEWGGRTCSGVSDSEGFVEIEIEPPKGLADGWHAARLSVAGRGEGRPAVSAPLLVVGERAEHGVISDIDDTIIVTGVRNLAKRAWALFMAEATERRPFEGVAELYQALSAGREGGASAVNPLFYVSSSPWNLYEHLDHFMDEHEIPPGPILLRDWGLTREGFAPGGGHGHKRKKMKSILDALPELPFVLIGDSGQEDAEHYRSLVEEYGRRIRVVYIRSVPSKRGRERRLEEITAVVRAAGSDLVVVESSDALREDARARGLVL